MNPTRARNLFFVGCFVAALALTWAGAAPRHAPVPTPIAVSCPSQQTEPPPLTTAAKAAPLPVPDDQPPATVQNLRRADRR